MKHAQCCQGWAEIMKGPRITYEEMSDTLYVSFEPGTKATGIELNEHILLRIDKKRRRAIGLTFLEYSVLVQKTDLGPRRFPLTGLAGLSGELREVVTEILLSPPVSDFLCVSAFTPSILEIIPITFLQQLPLSTAYIDQGQVLYDPQITQSCTD